MVPSRRAIDSRDDSLGFGIGLRRELAEELLRSSRPVDWLELQPESWMDRGGRDAWLLSACAERWPIVPHASSTSLGGPDPLDDGFLGSLRALAARLQSPWWSDHVAITRVRGRYLHERVPLPFSEAAAAHVAARADEAERRVGLPLAVENVTYQTAMPGSTLDEAAFLRSVLAATGAGLLLDVNSLYVNAHNHGQNATAAIDQLPLGRVRALHLSGHVRDGDRLVDTRATRVSDEVWELYAHVIARAGRAVPTLIEWDRAIPSLDRVLDELDRARALARWALTSRLEETVA